MRKKLAIAGLVAVSVVDELESIDIEEENGKGRLGSALRPLQSQIHPIVK